MSSDFFAGIGDDVLAGIGFDMAFADLDGDTDLDAVTTNFGPDRGWINQGALQGGTAGQLVRTVQALDTGRGTAVALGDVDGDTDVDALIGRGVSGAPQGDTVWLNNGLGTFSDSGQSLGNAAALAVALADLDWATSTAPATSTLSSLPTRPRRCGSTPAPASLPTPASATVRTSARPRT